MTLVSFYCPTHGRLCSASEGAFVVCGHVVTNGVRKRRCGKRATTIKPERKAAA